jgi:phage terminase large subunit-like protein
MVRDGLQTILFGDVIGGHVGSGLLPRDSIISIQMGRGIAGQIDYAVIKRDDGLLCKIGFKTYEQGRAAVQAEPVSLVVCDELLDDLAMWNELIARTTATQGIIRMTATERLQSSPVALWFRDNAAPDCITITGSVDDADHLTAEEKAAIKSSYKSEAELKTRYYGLPFQGGGSVFTTPISQVMERMEPGLFPVYYKYGIALDLSHFGRGENSSQFAVVFMAYDPMTKVIYLFDCFKMRGIVEEHVARIRNANGDGIVVFWPHDGTQGQADGGNIMLLYKKAGLRMYNEHATFEGEGGYNFESGIALIDSLLSTGRLKVASHLIAWRDEYLAYERDEDGHVIKRMDDLMSATRIGCMMVRAFRVLEEYRDQQSGDRQSDGIALGTHPDDPRAPWDIFSGQPIETGVRNV